MEPKPKEPEDRPLELVEQLHEKLHASYATPHSMSIYVSRIRSGTISDDDLIRANKLAKVTINRLLKELPDLLPPDTD